jgi:hypothetical protein
MKKMTDVDKEYQLKIRDSPSSSAALKRELDTIISQLTAECELRLKQLDESFDESVKLLLDSYAE